MAFRALIKLSDAIVRALNAVYRASAIKAVFLVLVCVAAYYGLEDGLTGVARNLVAAILIQYILMLALSLRLTGLKLSKVFGKMVPAFIASIGTALVALLPWLLIRAIEPPAIVGLVLAFALVGGGLLAIAWRMPWLFGKGRDNVLGMLAARLPSKGFLGRIRNRFESHSQD